VESSREYINKPPSPINMGKSLSSCTTSSFLSFFLSYSLTFLLSKTVRRFLLRKVREEAVGRYSSLADSGHGV
jgi:hypothetical protein